MERRKGSPLGKTSKYSTQYDPSLLFPISRAHNRAQMGVANSEKLPFYGVDIWNAYELSWLLPSGKPAVALATILIPCESLHIIESKSIKLYFYSFNNTVFETVDKVQQTIEKDFVAILKMPICVQIQRLSGKNHANQEYCKTNENLPFANKLKTSTTLSSTHLELAQIIPKFSGTCLDEQEIICDEYAVNPELLTLKSTTDPRSITETLYSDLLRSNCLVTNQPDWGSVQIQYCGRPICHAGLLRYIISFRDHNEFHEHCVERMFMDIMRQCAPQELTVYARYTRRGGLDINPIRSTAKTWNLGNQRLIRQ